jgi:hypothetical protein
MEVMPWTININGLTGMCILGKEGYGTNILKPGWMLTKHANVDHVVNVDIWRMKRYVMGV